MNILQITNTACSDTNQATGVNRVVTQLSDYWSRIHQDNCFHAYFEKGKITPLFKDSFCLKRAFTDQEFETFLLKNKINVIIFNYAANQMLDIQNNIYNIARKNNIKMVYTPEGFILGLILSILGYLLIKSSYCFQRYKSEHNIYDDLS